MDISSQSEFTLAQTLCTVSQNQRLWESGSVMKIMTDTSNCHTLLARLMHHNVCGGLNPSSGITVEKRLRVKGQGSVLT